MERITTSTFVTKYHYSIEEFKDRLGIPREEHVDSVDLSVKFSDQQEVKVTLAPFKHETGDGPLGSWSD